MASTSGQEEFLAVIRKSQEAVIAVVRNLAETVRTASPKLASVYAPLTDNLPKPPSVSMPFGDKLPGPEDAVARAYDFGEQLLASQRKFAEDLLKAKPEGAVASAYDFAEQLLASQRKFAEDLLKAAAPLMPGRADSGQATETYKPGQVVPRDGTVQCARHHDVQDHVKPAPDSHRAAITMSTARAAPGNTPRARQYPVQAVRPRPGHQSRTSFQCSDQRKCQPGSSHGHYRVTMTPRA